VLTILFPPRICLASALHTIPCPDAAALGDLPDLSAIIPGVAL